RTAAINSVSRGSSLPFGSDQSSYFGRWATATSTAPEWTRQTTPPAARIAAVGFRRGTALLAPVGETPHEQLLVVDTRVGGAYPVSVRLQIPRRGVIVEGQVEARLEVRLSGRVGDPAEHLHAPVEVAVHQVGRADPVLRRAAAAEVVDA